MLANEAPKKIYFTTNENGTHYYTEGIPFEREYIEFINIDAFIKKACEYLESSLKHDLGYHGAADFVDAFKKAMEE